MVEEILGNVVARVAYRLDLGKAYQIVGVESQDPPELAYNVWRVKAAFFHPDNQKTGNREAFERLAAAYARIKAEEK